MGSDVSLGSAPSYVNPAFTASQPPANVPSEQDQVVDEKLLFFRSTVLGNSDLLIRILTFIDNPKDFFHIHTVNSRWKAHAIQAISWKEGYAFSYNLLTIFKIALNSPEKEDIELNQLLLTKSKPEELTWLKIKNNLVVVNTALINRFNSLTPQVQLYVKIQLDLNRHTSVYRAYQLIEEIMATIGGLGLDKPFEDRKKEAAGVAVKLKEQGFYPYKQILEALGNNHNPDVCLPLVQALLENALVSGDMNAAVAIVKSPEVTSTYANTALNSFLSTVIEALLKKERENLDPKKVIGLVDETIKLPDSVWINRHKHILTYFAKCLAILEYTDQQERLLKALKYSWQTELVYSGFVKGLLERGEVDKALNYAEQVVRDGINKNRFNLIQEIGEKMQMLPERADEALHLLKINKEEEDRTVALTYEAPWYWLV